MLPDLVARVGVSSWQRGNGKIIKGRRGGKRLGKDIEEKGNCPTKWRAGSMLPSGVARILLQGGVTGAWRTGSEVHGDKVVQK